MFAVILSPVITPAAIAFAPIAFALIFADVTLLLPSFASVITPLGICEAAIDP